MNNAGSPTAPLRRSVFVKLVLVQFFWAGTFVASEIALHDQPAGITALTRFVLTTGIYAGLCLFLSKHALPQKLRAVKASQWLALVGMGFFGVLLYTVLMNIGLTTTTATYAALLIPTTQPIFTALLSRFVFREAASQALVAGLALGLVGAACVIWSGVQQQDATHLSGSIIILLSALSFSLYAVCSKFAPAHLTSLENTTLSFMFGTLLLIPVPWLLGEQYSLAGSDTQFWLSIAYLVIFATLLPYLWWNEATKEIGSARTGVFTFLMPPLAVVLSAMLLGHLPLTLQIIGGILAMLGVSLTTFNFSRSPVIKVDKA
ncbi:DMT family transporter [Pseudomonas syringae pv. theae]|nr:DMT family transporter [Pseudomonas syringae]MBL3831487.1 DMT family transporter [Pseudomonas syringae pv. theae]MBL3837323.1 DMT family transporter [Pseudomonas syringae pv. theae]MBL3870525.1 DMT family transporter [Pseudomonas syringae pv. theae]